LHIICFFYSECVSFVVWCWCSYIHVQENHQKAAESAINPGCHSFQGPLFAALRPPGDPRSSQLLPPRRRRLAVGTALGFGPVFLGLFFFTKPRGMSRKHHSNSMLYYVHVCSILCGCNHAVANIVMFPVKMGLNTRKSGIWTEWNHPETLVRKSQSRGYR
jgi:hypothetical protein